MNGRLRFVGVSVVCLALVGAVPSTAQPVPLERGLVASTQSVYTPPACVPGVPFSDITCTTGFDPWIEQFGLDGITAGCGGGKYCPGTPVTRDQMAVFIEKSMRGTGNWPPHVATAWAVKNSDGTPNPTASGTALLAAIASIPQTGNDAPSAANPWLVKVGPGIYDLGDAGATLPAWVSMEGAGEEATVITSTYGMDTLKVTGNGGVRFITINNTNSGGVARPLWVTGGSVTLAHVVANASNVATSGSDIALYVDTGATVTASDCSFTAAGTMDVEGIRQGGVLYLSNVDITASVVATGWHAIGISPWTGNGWTEVRNTRISVSAVSGSNAIGIDWVAGGISVTGSWIHCLSPGGFGVEVWGGNLFLSDTEIDALSGGMAILTSGSTGGSIEVHHSKILGGTWIYNAAAYTVLVGASELGGTSTNAGTLTCAGNYTSTGTFYANTCP